VGVHAALHFALGRDEALIFHHTLKVSPTLVCELKIAHGVVCVLQFPQQAIFVSHRSIHNLQLEVAI